jgi:hypothetical protein
MVSLQCKYIVIVVTGASLTSFYYCFILHSFLQSKLDSVIITTENQSSLAAVAEATFTKFFGGDIFWNVN